MPIFYPEFHKNWLKRVFFLWQVSQLEIYINLLLTIVYYEWYQVFINGNLRIKGAKKTENSIKMTLRVNPTIFQTFQWHWF